MLAFGARRVFFPPLDKFLHQILVVEDKHLQIFVDYEQTLGASPHLLKRYVTTFTVNVFLERILTPVG